MSLIALVTEHKETYVINVLIMLVGVVVIMSTTTSAPHANESTVQSVLQWRGVVYVETCAVWKVARQIIIVVLIAIAM